MKNFAVAILLFLASSGEAFSQFKQDVRVVQISGFAITADSLIAVPYTHITLAGRGRVASAGPDGAFSFPAALGDTLYFTCVGYRPVMYVIPKNIEGDKFLLMQLMTKSEMYLPTTVIYPWGDRANFDDWFRKLRLPEDQIDIAKRNIERQRLAALGQKLEHDAREMGEQTLSNQSATSYYYGQVAPQNILNPLAWADFIQAWKRGDFKNKNVQTNQGGNDNINYEDIYNTNGNH